MIIQQVVEIRITNRYLINIYVKNDFQSLYIITLSI